MKCFAATIALLLTLNCFGQFNADTTRISPSTREAVAHLRSLGFLVRLDLAEQSELFSRFRRTATSEELLLLTDHPEALVRCYAFLALENDSTLDLLPVVLKHIMDTARVRAQEGCFMTTIKAGDFFVRRMAYVYDRIVPAVAEQQKRLLDSLLIYSNTSLDAKYWALADALRTDQLYKRAKQLYQEEQDGRALLVIAEFRKEEDVPLILNSIQVPVEDDRHSVFYGAVARFPHPAFLPDIRELQKEKMRERLWSPYLDELYEAITAFQNDSALALLRLPFSAVSDDRIRRFHATSILAAINRSYNAVYNDLLWYLWEHEQQISPKIFNMLYKLDKTKSFNLTVRSIEGAPQSQLGNEYYREEDPGPPKNILTMLLDTIIQHNQMLALQLINRNIGVIDGTRFYLFAKKAEQLKDPSSKSALLARLEKADGSDIYYSAEKLFWNTRILISIKRSCACTVATRAGEKGGRANR